MSELPNKTVNLQEKATCLQKLLEQIETAFGIGNDLSVGQTALRTILIYGFTLVIVGFGRRLFFSKSSAFDAVVAIMLGSVVSRGINETDPMIVTIIAGVVLVGTHRLFGLLAFHTGWFGTFVKGERLLLIKDGKIQEEGMSKESITEHDLTQAVRMQTHHRDRTKVKFAYLERNLEISIVPYKDELQPISWA